jgi:5-methylcytosine-specific restriction endonuclease McrA
LSKNLPPCRPRPDVQVNQRGFCNGTSLLNGIVHAMGKLKKTNRTCEVCGCAFYKSPSHIAKWPARACSRTCAGTLKTRTVDSECKHCGVTFKARPSRLKNGFDKYCSKACDAAAAFKQQPVTCRWCRTQFTRPPHIIKQTKKHFCSKDCSMAWLKRYGTKKGVDTFHSRLRAKWLKPQCERCGATEDLQLDHIVPRFAGGKPVQENAQTLCRKCNRDKFWNEDLYKYSPDLSLD